RDRIASLSVIGPDEVDEGDVPAALRAAAVEAESVVAAAGAAGDAAAESALRNAVACVGAEISRDARTVRGVALAPYALRFASSSGRSTPPEMSIPANSPRAREYETISAVSCASVPTCPCRPSGP